MTDDVEDTEELEDGKGVSGLLPLPDLTGISDSFFLTDQGKTDRIRDLEKEVTSLTRQLTEAQNLVNTLYTELDRYKRVNGQVGWLIEQFRHSISRSDMSKTRRLPPLSPSTPPSLFLTAAEDEDSEATGGSEAAESVAEDVDAEDEYSEDWETTEEAEDHTSSVDVLYDRETPGPRALSEPIIGPQDLRVSKRESRPPRDRTTTSRTPRDPTPVPLPLFTDPEEELNALLAVATPQTLISDIYRRWRPPGPPPT